MVVEPLPVGKVLPPAHDNETNPLVAPGTYNCSVAALRPHEHVSTLSGHPSSHLGGIPPSCQPPARLLKRNGSGYVSTLRPPSEFAKLSGAPLKQCFYRNLHFW